VSETGQGFGILGVIEGVQLESVLNSHDRGPATVPDGVRHPCQTGRLRQLSAIVGRGLVATRAPHPRRAGRPDSDREAAATRRVYAGTLAALCATPGAERPAADLTEFNRPT
jgi:hypothetical protein